MIGMTALLLATSISGTADGIFRDGMDGDLCPDGHIVQSDILYGDITLTDVDVTLFENVWGQLTSSDPPTLWPGINGSTPLILDFTKTGYLAAKFHTLSDPRALASPAPDISGVRRTWRRPSVSMRGWRRPSKPLKAPRAMRNLPRGQRRRAHALRIRAPSICCR